MTLLPQITKSLNKGMKALGFTRTSQTRSYCISVNEATDGFVDFCTSTFAVEGRVICPIVSVANKPANEMLRTVVERTGAPVWYFLKSSGEPTSIQEHLWRLLPKAELAKSFVRQANSHHAANREWYFEHESVFDQKVFDETIAHMLEMIGCYGLPFLQSMSSAEAIYQAFVNGRVSFNAIKQTSKCNDPFIAFLSGRAQEAENWVLQEMTESKAFATNPHEAYVRPDGTRVETNMPMERIEANVEFYVQMLKLFEEQRAAPTT